MTAYEFVGWTLSNTTAVTAITSTRIYHGLRARSSALPAINYQELPGGSRFYGHERQPFTILCRATTPAGARDLARVVTTAMAGSAGTGITGTNNGFVLDFGTLIADQGLIPEALESGKTVYNAPIDIQLVYAASAVT